MLNWRCQLAAHELTLSGFSEKSKDQRTLVLKAHGTNWREMRGVCPLARKSALSFTHAPTTLFWSLHCCFTQNREILIQ